MESQGLTSSSKTPIIELSSSQKNNTQFKLKVGKNALDTTPLLNQDHSPQNTIHWNTLANSNDEGGTHRRSDAKSDAKSDILLPNISTGTTPEPHGFTLIDNQAIINALGPRNLNRACKSCKGISIFITGPLSGASGARLTAKIGVTSMFLGDSVNLPIWAQRGFAVLGVISIATLNTSWANAFFKTTMPGKIQNSLHDRCTCCCSLTDNLPDTTTRTAEKINSRLRMSWKDKVAYVAGLTTIISASPQVFFGAENLFESFGIDATWALTDILATVLTIDAGYVSLLGVSESLMALTTLPGILASECCSIKLWISLTHGILGGTCIALVKISNFNSFFAEKIELLSQKWAIIIGTLTIFPYALLYMRSNLVIMARASGLDLFNHVNPQDSSQNASDHSNNSLAWIKFIPAALWTALCAFNFGSVSYGNQSIKMVNDFFPSAPESIKTTIVVYTVLSASAAMVFYCKDMFKDITKVGLSSLLCCFGKNNTEANPPTDFTPVDMSTKPTL